MATSQKVTDQFLTCAVCMEFFKDPCTLECQHTFCGKCLVSFTETQPEAISAQSLPCPFCRSLTKVPNPDRPIDEWAKQRKPSFLILKLIDSFGPGTKDITYCRCCKVKGMITRATSWCSICEESFCEQCKNTHSHIRSLGCPDQAPSAEGTLRTQSKVMCKEHPTAFVDYLCKDCNKSICHKCCIRDHRQCESVVAIESGLSSMTLTLMNKKEELLNKIDSVRVVAEDMKLKLQQAEKEYSRVEFEIKTESQKARDRINNKETALLNELQEKTKTMKLRADIKTREMAIQMYQQQSELIDRAVKSDCERDIYEMYRSCDSWVDTDTEFKVIEETASVRFIKDTDHLMNILDELQLGEIDVMVEGVLDLSLPPVLQNRVYVRVKSDRNNAWPTDVTVSVVKGVEAIVVIDRNNNSVKSFYTIHNQQCHSVLGLGSGPWSLTQLKQNQVAVTVPEISQIVTVEVSPDLKLLSRIKTQKQYRGIVALERPTFAASSRSNRCVDILNELGVVLRSIVPSAWLIYPDFLCITRKGHILISDCGTKSVVSLAPEGNVVFHYRPIGDNALQFPLGITTTNTGDILIADSVTHNVVHLTESGQFVGNKLTSQNGVSAPRGLCVNRRGQLLVCHEGQVAVFKCKA